MASAPLSTILRHLFRMGAPPTDHLTDAGLLSRFAADRDEAAFAELVRRHGPMVLGICRRVLRDPDDADDAFQAAFLVLARKAAALDGGRPLGCWLYTVARNLALKQRTAAARRRAREKEASAVRGTVEDQQTAWRDLSVVLDAELDRLPEKYRAPLVLCHLQGLTHEAAARELGWPPGSMAKRLARGQELLRERLSGRGVALSGAALAMLIGQNASAAVSPAVVCQLARAAALYAAGQATVGLVTTSATALAGKALQAVVVSRWKAAAAALLALGVLGASAAVLSHRPQEPEVEAALPQGAAQVALRPAAADPDAEKVRDQLMRPINLDKGVDANTPLKDVLEFLNDRHELTMRLDEEAYAAAGLAGAADCPVRLPKMVGLSLETVLRLLLIQIEPRDGRISGYRIEQGTIVITPLFLENRPIERFPPGLPLRLFKPVRCDREPYGMTLAEALEIYGKLFGQKLVLDRQAFAEVGEKEPDRYPLAGWGRELPEEPCLVDVLELILWQVDGLSWKSYFRVRDSMIQITAAKHETEQALALAKEHGNISFVCRSIWQEAQRQEHSLRQPAHLDKGIEPQTPLRDALEFLADRYYFTILMDEQAFAGAGIDKVAEHAVHLPPQRPLAFETVLRKVLDQIKNDDYTAGFVLREGFIDVVPEHNQLRQKKPLESRHLDKLWEALADKSAARARLAEQTLAQAPREALAYLKERLKPAAAPDAARHARIRKLVADLDSNQFAVRQKATEELEKLAAEAVPDLRARLAEKPSLEVRQRLEQILERVSFPSTEVARAIRCVRVLETIGSAEARQLLEKLATTLPAEAARAALERSKR